MPSPSPLALRLAALREGSNKSSVSEASNTTPLEAYVRLYNKAKGSEDGGGSCYTNYMEGAKFLYSYLSPIEVPSDIVFNSTPIPALVSGYELGEIAKILTGETYGNNHAYVCSLITYYTAKHILESIEEARVL